MLIKFLERFLKRLILVTTDKGNLVLDPMCGTGSTALAAKEEGRVGVGIDLNPDLKKKKKNLEQVLRLFIYYFSKIS